MPTSTVEKYTKNIFLLDQEGDAEYVSTGEIAKAMGVVPGTATSMIKTLAKDGLACYEPRGGVKLTHEGQILALRMLRRHRLIEYFLVETLKMDWAEIHEEAETLEHAVSDRLLDKLDAFLGEPRFNPHGDPIPTADGKLFERRVSPLSDSRTGEHGRIARVSDQNADFLDFLRKAGLFPGTRFTVAKADTTAGILTLKLDRGAPVDLGLAAAEKIWFERA